MSCGSCSTKCCRDQIKCHTNLYSDMFRLQVQNRICCLLQLLANLEAALQDDLRDQVTAGPSPPAPVPTPSANTQIAALNLYNFFVDNGYYFAAVDQDGNMPLPPTTTPPVIANLVTFGGYRYLECLCHRVPFLWKNCSLVANYNRDDDPEDSTTVRSVSLFDLAKPASDRFAYNQTPAGLEADNVTGVAVEDYIATVCCLKTQFNLIKALME